MPFKIVRNDITKMQVDAIVNTANKAPTYASGTDTAVYRAAGVAKLLAERKKIGIIEVGDAAVTPGFKLPAKYIIHAVSPAYIDGKSGEEALLRACYKKSLLLAREYDCESIAFPLLATGNFGYPKEEGMRIAVDEINAFLLTHDMLIYLVVFDSAATKLGKNLYPELKSYIDSVYVEQQQEIEYGSPREGTRPLEEFTERCVRMAPQADICPLDNARIYSRRMEAPRPPRALRAPKCSVSLADGGVPDEIDSAIGKRMLHMTDTFQEYLMYLIETKGLTNAQVYKDAIISKQLFSKIKVNPDYHPDKATAMRLCIGAKLNLDETKDLLARAGYALSPCDKRDIIFTYFIEKGIYDIIEIDIIQEEYGLPCFIE